MTSEANEKEFLKLWNFLGNMQAKKILYTFEEGNDKSILEVWFVDGSTNKMEFET